MDFHEIWYLGIFKKICCRNSSFIKTEQKYLALYMKTDIHFWSYLAQCFPEWELFPTKFVEKINIHSLCSITFFSWKSLFWYLLTYSMVQSPSWEANWFAASQEIPCISRNPKVHYRTHKCPPPVSILGQPNPVHIPTSHLLEIHPNIIHPSKPRSPQWSLSFQFPHQDPIHPPLLTHTCHMPSPSHSWFYHPHNIGWGVQII